MAIVVTIAAIVSSAQAFLVWRQAHYTTTRIRDILTNLSEWILPAVRAEILNALLATEREVLLTMIGAGSGLLVVLAVYLLVMTHKVAGPLHKMAGYLGRLRDGAYPEVHSLRSGDQFKDFFERFRKTNDALRNRTRNEVALYDAILRVYETRSNACSSEMMEQVARIKALRDRRAAILQ